MSKTIHMEIKQTFYTTVEGKQKKYKFAPSEFELYKQVCEAIWGGLPYDLSWAWSTTIYQDQLNKILCQKQNF